MDPSKPESFNHRVEKLSTGRTYHFVDQLPSRYNPALTRTVLCVHGFPDFWYGWRYQIGPWVREGYRVVVPDMLGYGNTDKPQDANEYTTKRLCADLAALLDILGVEKAVLVGHDWGSHTVGRFALWYPNRLSSLVMLSVPYTPPSPVYLPIDQVAKKAPNLGYQVYFASQKSTTEIEANFRTFLRVIFRSSSSPIGFTREGSLKTILLDPPQDMLDLVLYPQELNYYCEVLSKGMNGPLNYYRTSKQRHEEESSAGLPSCLPLDLPVLFLWGTGDPTAVPTVIRKATKFIPGVKNVALENKGHWIMVEAKAEVTHHISDWLKGPGKPVAIQGKL